MTTHRSLATFAILATVGIALLGSAGVANASPQDDAYLAALRGVGLSWTPGTQAGLIQEAHDVCYNLTWGLDPAADCQRPRIAPGRAGRHRERSRHHGQLGAPDLLSRKRLRRTHAVHVIGLAACAYSASFLAGRQ